MLDITHYVGMGGAGPVLVGAPEKIADKFEHWIEAGVDGFNLAYAVSPGTFEDFIDGVVPVLKRRGRMQSEYLGGTLREKLFGDGKTEQAIDLIKKAIDLAPQVFIYQHNIGELLRRHGQYPQAIAALQSATCLQPDNPDAHYNLGVAYASAEQPAAAKQSYLRTLELDPHRSTAWNNLAACHGALDEDEEAESAYARAVSCDPGNAEAHNNLGAIYSADGRLEQAIECFEKAVALRPDFSSAHYNLSSLKTYSPNDPHLTALEDLASKLPVNTPDVVRYFFALGKAREDIGQYDRAFSAYAEANRRQHAAIGNEGISEELVQRVLALFNPEFFAARQRVADNPRRPIFILGMPRSGSTLIEQILACHPQVHGAGELLDLSNVIKTSDGAKSEQPFTEIAATLGEHDIQALATRYLDQVWQLAPGSPYISDKMPGNFLYIGMIYLLFPQARIIHSMRDPMDACFSNFTQRFNETMGFTYDLETLGRFYQRYIRVMRHWHEVLPAGSIIDIAYEDVVADVEKQTRRIFEFVGLPWDPACLEFFNNRRIVKTASVAQVRKPIYSSSVARWERFGVDDLAPLLKLVGNYRDREKPYGL